MFWRLCLFHSVNEILIIYLLRTKLSVPETVTSPYVSYGNGLTSEQEHRHALRSKRWQINDDYTRQAVLHLLCSWHAGWKLGKTWPHLNAIKITGKLEGIHLAHCTRAQLDRGLLILVLESSYSVIFFYFPSTVKMTFSVYTKKQHLNVICVLCSMWKPRACYYSFWGLKQPIETERQAGAAPRLRGLWCYPQALWAPGSDWDISVRPRNTTWTLKVLLSVQAL